MTDQQRDRSVEETQRVDTAPTVPAAMATGPEPHDEVTDVQRVVTPRRGNGARWGVAAVAILLIVAVAAGATMLLTGRAADPVAYTYLPSDTAMVLEIRPDLPGDQREKFARLLTRFPGFADMSALPQKIDEVLDRLSDAAAESDVDYANKVKPFLGGPIVLAVTKVPESKDAATKEGVLGVLTVPDASTCEARLGPVVGTADHAGKQLSLVELDGQQLACFVDGRQLLLGGTADVGRALDTKAGTQNLGADADLQAAKAKLSGDTLGLVFVSRAGMTGFARVAELRASPMAAMPGLDTANLPPWFLAALRAEDRGLLFDTLAPMPAAGDGNASAAPLASLSAPKTSILATKLPATTIAALELRDLGTMLDRTVTRLQDVPQAADSIKQLDLALGFVGGRTKVAGWMGDATVVVTKAGDTFAGGLVVASPKPDDAQATFTQLRTLLALSGMQGITTRDEPYGAGTITIVTLEPAKLAAAGVQAFGQDLPATVDLAYTVQDGMLVLGVGTDFVKAVIDTKPGSSLADQQRYKDAMSLVGASNSGQAYVDLSAGIQSLDALPIPGFDRTRYASDIQPYLEPIDAAAWSATLDGDLARIRFGITAHEAQSR